jgi:hypothetical protein
MKKGRRSTLQLIKELFIFLEERDDFVTKKDIQNELSINLATLDNLFEIANFFYAHQKILIMKKSRIFLIKLEKNDVDLIS